MVSYPLATTPAYCGGVRLRSRCTTGPNGVQSVRSGGFLLWVGIGHASYPRYTSLTPYPADVRFRPEADLADYSLSCPASSNLPNHHLPQ